MSQQSTKVTIIDARALYKVMFAAGHDPQRGYLMVMYHHNLHHMLQEGYLTDISIDAQQLPSLDEGHNPELIQPIGETVKEIINDFYVTMGNISRKYGPKTQAMTIYLPPKTNDHQDVAYNLNGCDAPAITALTLHAAYDTSFGYMPYRVDFEKGLNPDLTHICAIAGLVKSTRMRLN